MDLRINLLYYKQGMVDQIYSMLMAQNPVTPVPANSITNLTTIAGTLGLPANGQVAASTTLLLSRAWAPQDFVQAANETADMLLR